MSKVWKYTRALTRWVKAGRPTRSNEEIRRLYETCCLPCGEFDVIGKSCKLCGCRINLSNKAYMNKIAMATESCPAGKWGDRGPGMAGNCSCGKPKRNDGDSSLKTSPNERPKETMQ